MAWARALLVASCLLLAAAFASAFELTGRVVAVADGDTLTDFDASRVQREVRIAGMGAPVKKRPFRKRTDAARLG